MGARMGKFRVIVAILRLEILFITGHSTSLVSFFLLFYMLSLVKLFIE